jgi:hypothetical protein
LIRSISETKDVDSLSCLRLILSLSLESTLSSEHTHSLFARGREREEREREREGEKDGRRFHLERDMDGFTDTAGSLPLSLSLSPVEALSLLSLSLKTLGDIWMECRPDAVDSIDKDKTRKAIDTMREIAKYI